jgi:hypothetical protein
LLLVGGIYTWVYVRHPLNPGFATVDERVGWWSWSDQFKYLKATEAMAAGTVSREVYHYPLGYSALGVPFVRWLPAHPYFLPNMLLVLVTAFLWWRLARRWIPATVALIVTAGFIVTHGDLLRLTMVVPWNTLPTQVTLLAGMLVLLELKGRRAMWWLAGLAAITWWVRPGDALCFAPMLGWAVVRLPRWRDRIVCASLALAIIGVAVVAMGVLNLSVWDSWRTPYEQAAHTMVGFFSYPMAQKLFWTFIDARPFFGEADTALLWRYPWLFLAIPGVAFWLKREGAAGAAVLATLGLNWLLYLGYNDFFPSSFYRFSLIHYVSWSFLPLLAGAAAACWAGWNIRAVWLGWMGAVLVFVTASSLQLTEEKLPVEATAGEVSVLPLARPLWVRFPGESLEKVAALRLDGRAMLEARDYQIPYVSSDLKLLLSNRAIGTKLDALSQAGIVAVPQTGNYQWGWRWDWSRQPKTSF